LALGSDTPAQPTRLLSILLVS